jgi:hypothetical protein
MDNLIQQIKQLSSTAELTLIFNAYRDQSTNRDRQEATKYRLDQTVKFKDPRTLRTYEGRIENINRSGRIKIRTGERATFTCGGLFLTENSI